MNEGRKRVAGGSGGAVSDKRGCFLFGTQPAHQPERTPEPWPKGDHPKEAAVERISRRALRSRCRRIRCESSPASLKRSASRILRGIDAVFFRATRRGGGFMPKPHRSAQESINRYESLALWWECWGKIKKHSHDPNSREQDNQQT